ncbi:hypothetical protein BN110_020 [Yersinia phage phiR8-01]|uniref:Uncharacterized protein n=1 Tax=Yersinia phage phiR8-01 TaxID=1206556 RepID=I7KQP1_9CAUD|nr:hypothetical protein HOT05_gp09 [Yersinia phage phiR8-01]CCI88390.2 hypothetical protein BN110_020 [Yersinia phage phiR8-01]
MAIISIAFAARVPVPLTLGYEVKPCMFLLGPGRCGKTVSMLGIEYRAGWVDVVQHHCDGTLKVFSYKRGDVRGRIVVERDLFK